MARIFRLLQKAILLTFLCCIAPAMNAQTNDTTETQDEPSLESVIDALSRSLGIDRKDLNAQTNIVLDLGIDRTELFYALSELYLSKQVEEPDDELQEIGKIAEYIDGQRAQNLTLRAGDVDEIAYYNQRVFFATNRNEQPDSDMTERFGTDRVTDQTLRYGYVDVNIPTVHKEGQIETPWRNVEFLLDRRKHIFMTGLETTDEAVFFNDMKTTLAEASSDDIMIYIHGFNVTFDDAMIRAAQIAVDFDFAGLPIAFTWPSNGRTMSYAADWADAIWSAQYLETFLVDVQTRFPDKKIHILAHSMGNKVLLHAARQMAARGDTVKVENIILCAPDFDAQLFVEQIAGPVRSLSKFWTIYTSENDLALNVSNKLSAAPRLGSPSPEIDTYEVIDASKIEVSPWSVPENHSYYAVKSKVIADIAAVIAGTRPNDRELVLKVADKVWGF